MQTLGIEDSRANENDSSASSEADSQTVVIQRRLELDQANLVIKCAPGKITLLQDSDTGCLLPYQNALAGLEAPGFTLNIGADSYNSRQCALVGFGEKLPDESILAYLTRSGLSQSKVETALHRYEFAQYKFLTCAQLSQTAARQVSLLSACSGAKNILVMNDPFQPFSGRWREHFAELLLQEAKEKNRTIVIVNLSFMPQVWNDDSSINLINVSKSHERATQLAKDRKIREEKLREQKRLDTEKTKLAAEKNPPRTISFETTDGKKAEILDPSLSSYKAARDVFFAPFAAISNALRFFSGPALTLSMGLFLLIGAAVMFPGIKQKWQAMSELGAKINVTQDIKDALMRPSEGEPTMVSGQAKDGTNTDQPIAPAKDSGLALDAQAQTVEDANLAPNDLGDKDKEFQPRSAVVSSQAEKLHLRPRHNQSYIKSKFRRLNKAGSTKAAVTRSKVLKFAGAQANES